MPNGLEFIFDEPVKQKLKDCLDQRKHQNIEELEMNTTKERAIKGTTIYFKLVRKGKKLVVLEVLNI
jgi:hypothetical protein